MVQGYYTLEEAARILGMAAEDLSQMAQRREVRAFADRGTWRFRTQDIEELARRQGLASDPDLQLGEALIPQAHDSPVPKSPAESSDHGLFKFSLGSESDQVEIGQEVVAETPSGGPKSAGKSGGPKSSPPKPGSDSDVRLVPQGSDMGFQIGSDSDVKVVDAPEPVKASSARPAGPPKADSDSDVKIVPESSDETSVQLGRQPAKSGTDSDIRLEESGQRPSSGPRAEDSVLTEEIDLDAELRRAEEASRVKKSTGKSKLKPPASAKPATEAPKNERQPDSSSDFELKPLQEDSSPIELGSDEMKKLKDEEVALGELAPGSVTGRASDSGINLQDPADSGISLEQKAGSSEEIEFELSLDAEATPRPAPAQADSDSEFELTLDDSGRLAPLEEEAAPAKAKKGAKDKDEDKDIFETDFEVPALDESGSEAVALDDSDTDLESSDFDLALNEEDMATEEESGSQVVVLEDEDADEAAETVSPKARRRAAHLADLDEGADVDEILGEDEVILEEEDEAVAPVRQAAPAEEAEWGLLPVLTLASSVFLMFVVGLMSYELVHGMWGYRQPHKVSGVVVKNLAGLFGAELPKD